ncbi:MAG: inositol-3-phosphate synthase, partial [Candidatus Hodarchaeales archaeon]
MSKIKVAIAGLGNCASSLIQGLTYYKNADPSEMIPGLMHVKFGDYHIS